MSFTKANNLNSNLNLLSNNKQPILVCNTSHKKAQNIKMVENSTENKQATNLSNQFQQPLFNYGLGSLSNSNSFFKGNDIQSMQKHHYVNNQNNLSFIQNDDNSVSHNHNNRLLPQRDYHHLDESNTNLLILNQKQAELFKQSKNKSLKKLEEDSSIHIIHPTILENSEEIEDNEQEYSNKQPIDKYTKICIDSLLKKCLFNKNKNLFTELLINKSSKITTQEAHKKQSKINFINSNIESSNNKRILNFSNNINVNQSPFEHMQSTPMGKFQKNPILKQNSFNNISNLIENEISESKRNINENISEGIYYSTIQPDKILDAPSLKDDFSMNPLDWSSNNILAVALQDCIYLLNTKTNETQLLSSYDSQVKSLKWIEEGNCLAVGLSNGYTQLWDSEKMCQMRNLKGHYNRVNALEWSGMNLYSGGKDNYILNHDVRIQNPIVKVFGFEANQNLSEVTTIKSNFNNSLLVSGNRNGLINVYDINKSYAFSSNSNYFSTIDNLKQHLNPFTPILQPNRVLDNHKGGLRALSFCPFKKNMLISGGVDKTLKYWSLDDGHLINVANMNSHIYAINWNLFNHEIITMHGLPKNQISIWKFPELIEVGCISEHSRRPLYSCISPDQTTLVTGSAEEKLFLWKIYNNEIADNSSNHYIDLAEDIIDFR